MKFDNGRYAISTASKVEEIAQQYGLRGERRVPGGDRAGDEVVQIYARFPNSKISRSKRQLCGFLRVTLQAGERREIAVPVRGVDLAHWDESQHAFRLEPGEMELVVARSASDTQGALGLTLV